MNMTRTRMGLGLGAIALVVGLGATVYVAAQDQNNSGPRSPHMNQGPGGPGGPRAFGGRRPMGPARDALGGLPLGQLDLTEAQRAQVRTLVEANRAAVAPVLERARTAREALHAAMTASAVDEGAIRARSAEVATAEADLAVARARLQADISKLLTPEQRTQLEQARSRRADRMDRMRDRMQQRMGPPPPAR